MALAFYLLLALYLGRKNPVMYLLFPLALQQGPGAFIDQTLSVSGKRIFSIYDTVFNDVLILIILGLAVCFIKARFPRTDHAGSRLILAYLLYVSVLFLLNFIGAASPYEAFLTARDFLYIGLNYFLWLAIFSAATREDYERFLRLMFFVTPLSAVLYILNSAGIVPIFPREMAYSEIDYELSSFLRDFATMPFFLLMILVLSVQSLLTPILKVPRYILLVNIGVLPIALLFTFTRSLVIIAVMQLAVILCLNFTRHGASGIKNVLSFAAGCLFLLAPVYLVADIAFPNQVSYLTSRFTDASTEGKHEQNVDVRLAYLNKAIEITDYTSSAFGAGMNRTYYPQMNDIGAWKADSTIPFLLYHTGWVGVGFLYLILIFFCIDSAFLYYRTGDWFVAYLTSYFAATTVSSLIMGGGALYGSVWSFMNFAVFVVVRDGLWRKKPVLVPREWYGSVMQPQRPDPANVHLTK